MTTSESERERLIGKLSDEMDPDNARDFVDRVIQEARAELLVALKDIVDDLEARWDMRDPSTNPGIRDNVERAKAAISRAEGK